MVQFDENYLIKFFHCTTKEHHREIMLNTPVKDENNQTKHKVHTLQQMNSKGV